MPSPSHEGVRPVGTDAGDPAVPCAPMGAPTDLNAAPAFALASRTANQALSRQIEIAFDVGRALQAQSRNLARTAETTMPPGPWRESLQQVAQAQATFADFVLAQALELGRRFGGLAFAVPLPGRGR
ncbi:MAG: hypothetical protein U1F48_11350 [Burkholderiales bacterium]